MQSFKDSSDRDWPVRINVQLVKNVKAQTVPPVNIYGLVADGYVALAELLGDPCALVSVLYVLCEKQCESNNMTPEQFGEMFEGDIIARAGEAFVEALINFFPDVRVRDALTKLILRSKELNTKLIQRATTEANQALDGMDIESNVDLIYHEMKTKALASVSNGLPIDLNLRSTSTPESSESTQVTSPSPN